jgi:hypothetical protein
MSHPNEDVLRNAYAAFSRGDLEGYLSYCSDEIVFHDILFSNGKQVGDQVGSCVIVALTPEVLANCSDVMRLPGGTIAAQFANAPGPAPKDLALTGGTGTFRNVGGEGTLVEFGNSKGNVTLHVLGFPDQGGGDRQ